MCIDHKSIKKKKVLATICMLDNLMVLINISLLLEYCLLLILQFIQVLIGSGLFRHFFVTLSLISPKSMVIHSSFTILFKVDGYLVGRDKFSFSDWVYIDIIKTNYLSRVKYMQIIMRNRRWSPKIWNSVCRVKQKKNGLIRHSVLYINATWMHIWNKVLYELLSVLVPSFKNA